jgi:hypothetical protein
MLGRRIIVAASAAALLLAGCATKPNGDLDDRDCAPNGSGGFSTGSGDPLVDLAATLLVDITWFAGCEAVVGIANGIHHFHVGHAHDGVYYSPDGAFSVAAPMPQTDEYTVQQQSADGKDTVLFVPRDTDQPVYGVTVLTRLDGPQASLSLADFSEQASANLPGIGTAVTLIHAEDVQLGANPARLMVYRADAPAAGSAQADHYLMYFVKTAHTAAILSVTWPYQCPRCATGPASSLRDMDPALDSFVGSFELSSQVR